MSDLIERLRQFNRKERFFLIAQALGNENFTLSDRFRDALHAEIGIEIPNDAFVAMDYHLDWIAASLRTYRESNPIDKPLDNSDRVVTGTQQDVDLIIAFKVDETYHLVLLEAKGYSSWNNKQMRDKAQRLKVIFGQHGKENHPDVAPHFCLMSRRKPQRLNTDSWPNWMSRGHWVKLDLAYPRMQVTRCDSDGNSSARGGYFRLKEIE